MQMPRASDADKQRFRSLVPADRDVEVKPMFGNLGAFVNGNMFAGLFGSSVGVKLSDADLAELRAVPWVERALAHVSSLPPKAKKAARKR